MGLHRRLAVLFDASVRFQDKNLVPRIWRRNQMIQDDLFSAPALLVQRAAHHVLRRIARDRGDHGRSDRCGRHRRNRRGAKGPEAGVWVIAETDAFTRASRRSSSPTIAVAIVIPDLPAAKYAVWVRGYGLADPPRVAGDAGQAGRPQGQSRPTRRPRRKDVSGGVLVLDDEAARRSGSRAAARAGATNT